MRVTASAPNYDAFGYDLGAGFRYHGAPVAIDDVAEVVAEWKQDSDEPDFAWLLRLKDGRFAAATGWHDYTGWDCQSGFELRVFATKEEAIRLGFTVENRQHLGLSLPGEAFP